MVIVRGVVVMFDADRGFGFIRVPGLGEDVHVRQRDLPGSAPLKHGQSVTFGTTRTAKGLRATNITVGRRPIAPQALLSAVAAVSALLLAAGLIVVGVLWWMAWLVAVTLVTFAAYGWDKRQARTAGMRVPELTLHLLALLGGTLGALTGSYWFRHKTRKRSFQLILATIAALQAAIIAANFRLR